MAVDYKVPDKPKPPKTRYPVTDNPAEQVPLKDCVLESPIGDWHDGKFRVTEDSLRQFRGAPYKVKA